MEYNLFYGPRTFTPTLHKDGSSCRPFDIAIVPQKCREELLGPISTEALSLHAHHFRPSATAQAASANATEQDPSAARSRCT